MKDERARGALGGVLQLSFGTVLIRTLTASAQFVMAIWLVPTEFGHWAAALSSVAFAVALTNFGMVDGYLSGHGLTFSRLVRDTTRLNCALLVPVLLIGIINWFVGRPEIAVLVFLCGCNVPLTGFSEVLLARRIKEGNFRIIVGSQAVAGLIKLGTGVGLAYLTGSASAIGLSAIFFSLTLILVLLSWDRPSSDVESVGSIEVSLGSRLSWAANALASKLPLYTGFFVAQFLTTPEILGIYYLSYQAVVAVSSVVAPPFKRIVLTTMAQAPEGARMNLALVLGSVASSAMAIMAATSIIILPVIWIFVPLHWVPALMPIMVFMGQLPARMLSPVLDAFEQAGGKWWKSTGFHVLDNVVIAVASLAALSGNVVWLALSISISRVLIVFWRYIFVLGFRSGGGRWIFVGSLLVPSIMIASAVLRSQSVLPAVLGLTLSIVLFIRSWRQMHGSGR